MLDDYAHEALRIEIDASLPAVRVALARSDQTTVTAANSCDFKWAHFCARFAGKPFATGYLTFPAARGGGSLESPRGCRGSPTREYDAKSRESR